jgi:hypothetical protein
MIYWKQDEKALGQKHAITPPPEEKAPKKTHIILELDEE